MDREEVKNKIQSLCPMLTDEVLELLDKYFNNYEQQLKEVEDNLDFEKRILSMRSRYNKMNESVKAAMISEYRSAFH